MKPLPKHMRPRWRYLAVSIRTWPDASLSRRSFQQACWSAARGLLGDVGSARLDLGVYGFEHADTVAEAVVRTSHQTVPEARAVLACVTHVDGAAVGVRVRGVSGTVKSCEEKYLGRRPEDLREIQVVFDNDQRQAVVRDGLADIRTDGSFVGATTLDFE